MTKANIMLEIIGDRVRLTLYKDADETSRIMFENLKWVCENEGANEEQFTVEANTLMKAIQAYRAASLKPRRGKALWKEAPFLFHVVNQHNAETKGLQEYNKGEYQDGETNPWEGYKPSLSKLFNS